MLQAPPDPELHISAAVRTVSKRALQLWLLADQDHFHAAELRLCIAEAKL